MNEVIIIGRGTGRIKSTVSMDELMEKMHKIPDGSILVVDYEMVDIDFSSAEKRICEIIAPDLRCYMGELLDTPPEELRNERPFAPVPPWHRSYKTNKKRLKR